MYNVYFNDGANEPAKLNSFTTIEDAKSYISDYLEGKTLVDDEHDCSDCVFYSAAVAQLEVYDDDMIKIDEDDEAYFDDFIFASDYFYTR